MVAMLRSHGIRRVMLDLVSAPLPTAALLRAPGTGGAALAPPATGRSGTHWQTWVSRLAPEGAAAQAVVADLRAVLAGQDQRRRLGRCDAWAD